MLTVLSRLSRVSSCWDSPLHACWVNVAVRPSSRAATNRRGQPENLPLLCSGDVSVLPVNCSEDTQMLPKSDPKIWKDSVWVMHATTCPPLRKNTPSCPWHWKPCPHSTSWDLMGEDIGYLISWKVYLLFLFLSKTTRTLLVAALQDWSS